MGRFHKSHGCCTPISKHIIVKARRGANLTEAATMKFVAERTSIPVPKVYCSFVYKDCTYIVMERIRGEDLPGAWGSLSETARQQVTVELKVMVQQLRALKPSSDTGVESCIGGALYDPRLPSRPLFGPFKSIRDFHFWLREGWRPANHVPDSEKSPDEQALNEWLEMKRMADMQDGLWPLPVFTHGDLNPFNIRLRDGKVVGIIDWECSGWYPCYWEYTSAWHGAVICLDWRDVLDQFLDVYPAELEMERVRQRWWGLI
jgi:aminoglycoside phosphotransferase